MRTDLRYYRLDPRSRAPNDGPVGRMPHGIGDSLLNAPTTGDAQVNDPSGCIASRSLLHLFKNSIPGLTIPIQEYHAHTLGVPQVIGVVSH